MSRLFVNTWLYLIALTLLTVTVASIKLGFLSVAVALIIAGTKASLVLMNFMHLRFEPKVLKAMFLFAISTIVIILILTFIDTALR